MLYLTSSEDMSQVKVFVTDRRTDRGTDRQTDEWDLMSPRFRESGGQKLLGKNQTFVKISDFWVDPFLVHININN